MNAYETASKKYGRINQKKTKNPKNF